jgi:hypothetical protein
MSGRGRTGASVALDGISGGTHDGLTVGSSLPGATLRGKPVLVRAVNTSPEVAGGWYGLTAGAGNKAIYVEIAAGAQITGIGAEIKFLAGGGLSRNGVIALPIWTTPVTAGVSTPTSGFHFTISRTAWGLQYINSINGALISIGYGALANSLSLDTPYLVQCLINGDIALILLPDGSVKSVTHPKIRELAGNFACVEPYQANGATDDLPFFRSFWYSTENQLFAFRQLLAQKPRDFRPPRYYVCNPSSGAIPGNSAFAPLQTSSPVRADATPLNVDGKVLVRTRAWISLVSGQLFYRFTVRDWDGAIRQQPQFLVMNQNASFSAGGAFVDYETVLTLDLDRQNTIEWEFAGSSASPGNIEYSSRPPLLIVEDLTR